MKRILILIIVFFNLSSYGQSLSTQYTQGKQRVADSIINYQTYSGHYIDKGTTGRLWWNLWDYTRNVYDTLLLSATGVSGSRLNDSMRVIYDSLAAIRADISSSSSTDSFVYSTKLYRQKAIDSLNILIALRKLITDSTTSTGYSTRGWRQKLADSINTALALKVNFTDTNSMLANYAIEAQMMDLLDFKVDYSDSGNVYYSVYGVDTAKQAIRSEIPNVSGKLNISDTSSMLLKYLRKADSSFNGGYETYYHSANTYQPIGNYLTASLTDGKIWIGNVAGVPIERTISGDVTISNTGAVTIANDAVNTQKIIDGAVTNDKITNSTIDLTTKVTGILPVSNGGTNANTTTSVNGTPITYGVNNTLAVGVVSDVTSGNLSPIFTTSVTGTSTKAITYTLSNAAAYTVLCNTTNASAAPVYSKIDLANMTYGIAAVSNGGTGTASTTSVNATPITYGANNTITASANTLTSTTLNPTVVTSSLTSVGTVTSGTWNSTIGTSATATTASIDDNSTKIATTAYVQLYIPSDTTISAAYTLTSRDLYRTIHCTNGSNIALTVPTGLGTRFTCVVIQEGAGTVTPTTSSTTFYYIPASTTKTKQQGSQMVIRSTATANTFSIQGDLQ